MHQLTFAGVPMCTSPEDYKKWTAVARYVPPGRAGFCTDCTKEYQQKMHAQKLCKYPGILFDSNDDGCIPSPFKLRTIGK